MPNIWPLFGILFFLFFGHPCDIWKFPGQGSNPSWSCNLCHSCINAGSPAHCTRLGIEPVFPWRWAISLTHCARARTPLWSIWTWATSGWKLCVVECGVVGEDCKRRCRRVVRHCWHPWHYSAGDHSRLWFPDLSYLLGSIHSPS